MSLWPRDPSARRLAIAAVVAILLVAGVVLSGGREAFVAYLIAWLFVLGICTGAMVMRMVHVLTGGRWGEAIRPPLMALTAALPLVALLVVPLFFGLHELFAWSRPEAVAASELLQKKAGYLNVPFFAVRTVAALGIWSVLAWRLVALDALPARDAGQARAARLKSTSIAGIILYAFSVTWFGVDWVMSLVPQWKSTGFGLVFALGQTLAGFAAALAGTGWASRGATPRADAQTLNDLGNIALTLVLLWAYLAFMQYLIVWIGDQPPNIAWYLPRVQTSWAIVGILLVLAHFAVPFLVLLFRRAKRSAVVTAALGAGLLAAHWVDVFWLVAPGFNRGGFSLHWMDIAATAAMLVVLRAAMSAPWALLVPGVSRPGWPGSKEARDHG
jgi:hypothetical protein